VADIKLILDVDSSGAIRNIQTTRQEIDQTAKSTERAGSGFSSMWKQVAIGTVVAQAATKAVGAFKDMISSSIEEAMKQEEAEKALEAALLSTGRTIQGNIDHYKEFASAQQAMTRYADDQIMAAQTLLVQMTRLNQEGIDKATKGAMGLASTLKMDLQIAALLVAKAMEGNFSVLSRYGIKVAENLSEEEKRAQLLEKLSVFYNRATAETDTYAVKIEQLKNYLGDLKEMIGDTIIRNEDFLNLLEEFRQKIEALTKSQDFKLWLSAIAEGMGAVARASGKAVEAVAKFGASVGQLIGGGKNEAKQNRELEESFARLEAARERAIAAGAKSVARTKQLTEESKKEKAAINETGNAVDKATKEDEKARKAKEDLAKATQEIINRLFPLEAKIREVLTAQQTLTKSYELGLISLGTYQQGMAALERELERITRGTQEVGITTEMTLQRAERSLVGLVSMAPRVERAYTSGFQKIRREIERNIEAITEFLYQSESILSRLDGVFAQIHTNEEIRIENEYKKRLEQIQKSTMSEEEKQKAIQALEAEYEIQRTAARRKAAKEEKAVAIFSSIIETARAVTEALPNLFLAAVVAAIGAARTAFIAAQPIPLAQGAIFEKPTRLLAETGREYLVGEAGREILGSEKMIRDIVRQETGTREIRITIPLVLEVGQTTLMKEIVQKVKLATRTGEIRLDTSRAII